MTQRFKGIYRDNADRLSGKTIVGVEYTGKYLQITCDDGDVFILGAYRERNGGQAYLSVHENPQNAQILMKR